MNYETSNNTVKSTETECFAAWHASEKEKGLVDVKFCTGNVQHSTVESFCAEVNRAIAAKTVNDPDIL